MNLSDLDEMYKAYVACALWSSTTYTPNGTEEEALDSLHSIDDLAPKARQTLRRDCEDFVGTNLRDLEGINAEDCGHDLWLTRNHHGAGFWGRGLGEVGIRLTKSAESLDNITLYLGDDGLIHTE